MEEDPLAHWQAASQQQLQKLQMPKCASCWLTQWLHRVELRGWLGLSVLEGGLQITVQNASTFVQHDTFIRAQRVHTCVPSAPLLSWQLLRGKLVSKGL